MTGCPQLTQVYQTLLAHFGPQHWWPADDKLEIVIGAVLVQNTSWQNVSKALLNMKKAGALTWPGLNRLSVSELAGLIRSSGYHNIKAQRLHNLLALLKQYRPWLKFFQQQTAREQLLEVKGIGPETADALLLYVGEKPVFVVDAYTLRIASRHGWLPEKTGYARMQKFFMDRLPLDVELFNEFHALLVALAKSHCFKNNPNCRDCPLASLR